LLLFFFINCGRTFLLWLFGSGLGLGAGFRLGGFDLLRLGGFDLLRLGGFDLLLWLRFRCD
jgi:hypothetical protein